MNFIETQIASLCVYKQCTFLPEYKDKVCVITSFYENYPNEAVNVTFIEDNFNTTVWIKNLEPLTKEMFDEKLKSNGRPKIIYKIPRLVIED